MKKNVVKINESALRRIVAESVKKVLKEDYESIAGDAYGIIQYGISELVNKYGVTPEQAFDELLGVFKSYSARDLYDEDDE